MEVVVLACSRVDGRGSRDLGDGSGTCLSVVEHDDPDVVVHVRFSERYMAFFGHRYLTFCYPGLRRRSLYTWCWGTCQSGLDGLVFVTVVVLVGGSGT